MGNVFRFAKPETAGGINVSSHSNYQYLSPFSYSEDYAIPVPGQKSTRSDSVEGIWQGLKIINSIIDPSLFTGKPHKRKGLVEGHSFENNRIDYLDARKKIFVPAYVYHVINNAVNNAKVDLEARIKISDVLLYDVESNGDIEDLSTPYAHSALLADILNVLLIAPIPPFNKKKFEHLEAQALSTIDHYKQLEGQAKRVLDEIITFAYLFSGDEVKEAFALHVIARGISHNGRLNDFTPMEKNKELCRLAVKDR